MNTIPIRMGGEILKISKNSQQLGDDKGSAC